MAQLLISKINDIKIIQVGQSNLSIENESEDGGKFGGRKIGFATANAGEEKTIDLGKGKRKHTLRIYAFERSENDALLKIFYGERFCTIVDKFKGKIKVYIDSVDIIDSDKHVNRTIYDISCTVQSAEFSPTVNVDVRLASEIEGMESEIDGMVYEFADMVDSTQTKADTLTGALEFVDSALNILRDGINDITNVQVGTLNAYSAVKHRIDTAERLFETIKGLKDFPDDLTKLLKGETRELDTDKKANLGKTQKSEITEIVEPLVNGIRISELETSGTHTPHNVILLLFELGISQIEIEIILRELASSYIVNKTKVIRDMNSILSGGFNNRSDFELTINAIVERLNHVGYSIEKAFEIVHLVRSFANAQTYREIIEIEIKSSRSLVSIVYNRYGNLDNYPSVEALNSFANNDYVIGKILLFS